VLLKVSTPVIEVEQDSSSTYQAVLKGESGSVEDATFEKKSLLFENSDVTALDIELQQNSRSVARLPFEPGVFFWPISDPFHDDWKFW
jgi:hypothetical protein